MSLYTSVSGRITQIDWFSTDPARIGCSLMFTLQSEEQGIVNLVLDGSVYVLNSRPLNVGQQATFFYSSSAPVPLIYPPQYRAVAAAHTPSGTFAALDVFTQTASGSQLADTDNTLQLNLSGRTRIILPNGQPFGGALSGKLLLVIYRTTTRSIPPQTSPELIVVFCEDGIS
ncbi:MAG: hypothetical protein ACI4F3_00095 [Enterocloster sp.]